MDQKRITLDQCDAETLQKVLQGQMATAEREHLRHLGNIAASPTHPYIKHWRGAADDAAVRVWFLNRIIQAFENAETVTPAPRGWDKVTA
jgi:hypothetical protein